MYRSQICLDNSSLSTYHSLNQIHAAHKRLQVAVVQLFGRVSSGFARFRPTEVPIVLADTDKARSIGFRVKRTLSDIISDPINYFSDSKHRSPVY